MNPFEPTGPEIPAAPIEVPTPNLPPADFTTIGSMFASGWAAVQNVGQAAQNLLALIAQIVGVIVTALLKFVESIVAWLLTLMFKVWNNAEAGTDQISAAAVGGIFGVPVSPSAFQSVGDTTQRQALAGSLIGTITQALGAGFTGPGAGPITPSSQGANKFMQTALNMSIEGWLQGWLAEAFSLGVLQDFGDLKDILERSLAIGRMAQRVMRPPIKIFVTDPFTKLLNSTYLPTQLTTGVAIKEYIRGALTIDQLTTILGYEGIPPAQIPALINDARPHLSAGQLVTLVNSGQMDQSVALQELQNVGYDQVTAQAVYNAEATTRVAAMMRQYVQVYEDAMVARKLDVPTFNSLVDSLTVGAGSSFTGGVYTVTAGTLTPIFSAAEGAILKATAYAKRCAGQKEVPIGTAQQLFNLGLIGIQEYGRLLTIEGYRNGEASIDEWSQNVDLAIDNNLGTPWINWQELLATEKEITAVAAASAKAAAAKAKTIAAQNKLLAAQQKAATLLADEEAKGVSIAKYETLVLDGLKTIQQYQAFLAEKGIAADNIAAFTTILQGKLASAGTATTATGLVVGSSKAKGLSLAQLEAGVKQGFLTLEDFQTELVALGYTAAAAQVVAEVLKTTLAAAQLKASTGAAAAAALGERKVSLAQEENAVLLGLQTIAQYQAMLAANGFDIADQEILVGELQSRLAIAKAAAAKKAATSGAPNTRPLSLGDVEKLVRAGIQTPADYQAALAAEGYDAPGQADLMGLLQLVLTHDQHVAAASGKSNALLTAGGLSLAQVRTAVKLGVVPISAYDSALTAAGVSGSDAAVLHASLAAQLAATATTAAAVKRVNAALATSGQTVESLERQVLAGSLSVDAFGATLTAAGVQGSDVAALTAQVTDMQANNVAAASLVSSVTKAAAEKKISLAEFEAAVKAGVQTIDQLQAFVESLGYSDTDVAILIATEADKLGLTAPTPPAPVPTS